MHSFVQRILPFLGALVTVFLAGTGAAVASGEVKIGLTAEFGVQGSHAAQSIEKGILLAIDEINAAGGVLRGRKLVLETKDDRGVPARGVDNYSTFAADRDLVAVFCGRFSPVAIEIAQVADRERVLLLDPWAAADPITAPPASGKNFVFRLSLTDSWALAVMVDHLRRIGKKRVAVFLPNTAWGRSSLSAFQRSVASGTAIAFDSFWYNWGDTDFRDRVVQARALGAEAVLMVANEMEGSAILKQIALLPVSERLPIVSHWGILGGDFGISMKEILAEVDFSVVHTFSFSDPRSAAARRVAEAYRKRFGSEVDGLRAQVGFAHAYDLTHLLAKAISKAGSTDREAIRVAMEQLGPHQGLLKRYERPFTPGRHEALEKRDVVLGRFGADGNLRSGSRK